MLSWRPENCGVLLLPNVDDGGGVARSLRTGGTCHCAQGKVGERGDVEKTSEKLNERCAE